MHYNGNFVTVKITSVNKRLIKMYNKWPSAALSVQQKHTGVGGGKGELRGCRAPADRELVLQINCFSVWQKQPLLSPDPK